MKKHVIFTLLILAASYATLLAQQPNVVISDKTGWHKIGETTVDYKTENDEIHVIGANRFSSIKIVVTDAPH